MRHLDLFPRWIGGVGCGIFDIGGIGWVGQKEDGILKIIKNAWDFKNTSGVTSGVNRWVNAKFFIRVGFLIV